jgi:hypothetical protein
MNSDDPQIDIDAIDALIDDVAREITSAPANEGLARRVSARIGEMGTGTAHAPRTWLLAPAAAVCVLALALFVARETRKPAAVPPAVAVRSVEPTGPAGPAGPVRLKPDATPVTPAASATTTAPTLPRSARAAAARPASPGFEPLALAPIVLDTLDVSPLVVAMPIELSAIAIDRIEIPAMP